MITTHSKFFQVFTDYFSGPVKAIGRVCVCVLVFVHVFGQQLLNEVTLDLDI